MTSGEEGAWNNRLKAKEKVLVQLYLHKSEPEEDKTFPFEVTQKGLSEHLGLRRSHVAMALQELVKDELVWVCKGHISGAQRRQNAYCISSRGHELATEIRARLLSVKVQFETIEGTRAATVEEILGTGTVSLASIIYQMDRGGPVRDEITVMTKPDKNLISVFCPTCKKQIEVDNFFVDEEVGFDCPGCGRPYRIVPALKTEKLTKARPPSNARPAILKGVVILSTIMLLPLAALYHVCFAGVYLIVIVIALASWNAPRKKSKRVLRPATPARTSVIILIAGSILLILWHLFVARIDLGDELILTAMVVAVIGAAYTVFELRLPDFKGDYMIASGTTLILIAMATTFVVDFGSIGVSTAPFLGIAGAALFAFSTFHSIDRDARVLDAGAGVGVFMLLTGAIVAFPKTEEAMDYIAIVWTTLVGLLLIGLRVLREITGAKDISTHLIASLPLPASAALLVVGIALIDAGALTAGLVELAAIAPLAYFGLRELTDDKWLYRVPITALIACFVIIALTAGIIT